MNKRGTIAVYVKSESGDEYLYCYENMFVEDIEKNLRDDLEMFCPICTYMTAGNNEDFVSDVDTLMEVIYKDSWERNDE